MLYFSFYIFAFLLNFVFTLATFIPAERYGHATILIDKKIYFLGGYKINVNATDVDVTNEFFYLDVSKPFTTNGTGSIPWTDLTYTGSPWKDYATLCTDVLDSNSFFVFGGLLDYGAEPSNQPFTNKFDTSSLKWLNITTNAKEPSLRNGISCANFGNGSTAIYSGFPANDEFWIFDALTFAWSVIDFSNTTGTPMPRWGYNALTLRGGIIIYIGGRYSDLYMPLNHLPLYNTTSGTWNWLITAGQTPPSRDGFSTVLTSDGHILFFGGNDGFKTLGDLWTLDLRHSIWISKDKDISNPIDDLKLTAHTATLVDNFMFVAFGNFLNGTISSKIFILDISQPNSYKWVTEYTPS